MTDEPPGYSPIEAVPTGPDGSDVRVTIEALGDGEYRVDPYPFDESPLTVSVPVRTVDRDRFDDETAFRRAYYLAGRETRSFTVRREER